MNKVLFVVASFVNASGAERTLVDYLKLSTDDNYVLLIGTNAGNQKMFQDILIKDHFYFWNYVKYHNTPLTRFFLMGIEAQRVKKAYFESDVYNWVTNQHFDCMYLNNTLENALFMGIFGEYPVVSHIHDMVRHLRPAWGYCGAMEAKKAGSILTPSDATAKELCTFGIPREKVNVVYNGVSFANHPFHRNYDDGILTVGFVGGALPRKGFDFLVEAVNVIEKNCSSYGVQGVRLIIATNTPENKYFNEVMQRLNKTINVEVNRNLDHHELAQKYQLMDILMVPSRNDPAPLVVAEGFFMGCCVMGSCCDGIPEMIQEQSLIFEKDDLESLLNVVDCWLTRSYSEQRTVINTCQQFILNRFNATKKKNDVQKIIEDVIAGYKRCHKGCKDEFHS